MGGGGGGGSNRLGDIRSLEEKAKAALQGGKRNVFISFATEDMNEVNLLRAHSKNENSDIEFNDHSVKEPYDSERAAYIKQKIGERIDRASICVVYISANTHRSDWVTWEVDTSVARGKKVVAVFAKDTPPSPLPEWVNRHKVKLVPWSRLAGEL